MTIMMVERKGDGMMVEWTFDPAEVQWVVHHLRYMGDGRLASLAPEGFPAYGRLLHPAHDEHGRTVRWNEVAAHHQIPLHPTHDFLHVALP